MDALPQGKYIYSMATKWAEFMHYPRVSICDLLCDLGAT